MVATDMHKVEADTGVFGDKANCGPFDLGKHCTLD
jgi:hypothetical protein